MITAIQKLKSIGCYEEFIYDSTQLPPFKKVNIFYGPNGSGKTTLSNVLYLLSKNCKDKDYVYSQLFDVESELELKIGSSKITHKNIVSQELDLYVFNSKFVIDHVYNGNVANVDSFSDEVRLTNDVITSIDNKLNILSLRNKKVENWKQALQSKLDIIWGQYDKDFQKKVSNARLTGVKPTILDNDNGILVNEKSKLERLYQEYKIKSEESATIEKLEGEITKIYTLSVINIDLDETIKKLPLKVSVDARKVMSDKINKLTDSIEAKNWTNHIGNLNAWMRVGGRLLHISKEEDSRCPLCNSDLSNSIDDLLNEFSNYFSNSIVTLFDFIDVTCLTLDTLITEKFLLSNRTSIDLITRVCADFNIVIPTFNIIEVERIDRAVNDLNEKLKQKKLSPDKILNFSDENISQIKAYNDELQLFKTNAVQAIRERITTLQKRDLNTIVREIKAQLSKITKIEFNQESNSIFTSKKNNSKIAQQNEQNITRIDKSISDLKRDRNIEVSKLNAESKYINLYLNYLGIDNFSIERVKDVAQDNLIITYKKTGKTKNKLHHSLSEGEKTALAFAYFISKLRVEKIEGNSAGLKDCTIVIDDPISSLDDNRLFQTANLIDSFIFYNGTEDDKHPKQLFVFSHNLTFIKYLYSAIKSNKSNKDNTEEYYLNSLNPQIRKIPSGLKNFTNTYIIKLKEIQNFKDNLLPYETAKNYLPNYIRIVLETFLSFKLAMVNDSKDMLPGMTPLINALIIQITPTLDETIGGINKDTVIKKLNHLKRIADHESHGSINKAEEFSFIAEKELKEFAKSTLQVINYIDQFHFKRIGSHS
jgi:wobble nucleotide-excising tRNase